ncbi:helix-turn-helix transcriptional regulator [Chitinibacter fontanus]|uniref:Helix-turn-helix transcriptional regulator n=2 Tax=Chitinibacter fontanus TaxID=1737446 RepID=A0A7D5Z731_9NEIS|nr:helix-turn-helix transcriptional regulator [Chitinibacter fontanus]
MEHTINWFACMSFSARLIALRKEKGLTQQGLADATHIHVQQIKRYEAGTSEPSAEALRKIARAFSISTDWLLFEDGERGPSDDLRLQFEAVSHMPEEERHIVKALLEGMILKYQTKQMVNNLSS